MNSYYSEEELSVLGLMCYGKDVLISRNTCILNPEKLRLGNNTRIDDYTVIIGEVDIGSHVHIAAWNYINGSSAKIAIGDFSTLSGKCSIYTTMEGIETRMISEKTENMGVVVEEEVVFGMGSILLPGTFVKIGNAFGAMSVAQGIYDAWGVNVNYHGEEIAVRVKDRRRELLMKENEFLKVYNNG